MRPPGPPQHLRRSCFLAFLFSTLPEPLLNTEELYLVCDTKWQNLSLFHTGQYVAHFHWTQHCCCISELMPNCPVCVILMLCRGFSTLPVHQH